MKTPYKKILISTLLFLFIFCFLGLPFTHWWFNGDDFSALAIGKNMQTWKTFFAHFLEGRVDKYFYPSHHQLYTPYGGTVSQKFNFMGVYYRPLHCAYMALAYWLFGLNAYCYYLISAFLHALNTTILFNIFSWFASTASALFFALLFALHPQIGFRFGAPANFQYYANVLLILLTVVTLKQFLINRRRQFLFYSTFLFTLALLSRETAIILPAILFVGSWLYQQKISWAPLVYGISATGYLTLRISLYPFAPFSKPSNTLANIATTLLSKIHTRLNEVLVFLYDNLTLSWLPYGHKLLRLSLLIFFVALIVFLFIHNKNKLFLFFLAASYCLMLWPSILGAYSPRYFYEASPLLFAFFAFLVSQNTIIISAFMKKINMVFASSIICLYALFSYINLQCRETKLFTTKQAFLALTNVQRITSGVRPLCFLAFPIDGFGTGIEQAAWLFLTPPTNPVYYDPSTMLTQIDSNILEHAGWYMRCAHYYTKNYFTIIHTPQSIRLTSINPQKINFAPQEEYLSMGTKTIHQTAIANGLKVVTDFTLTLDQKYLEQKPIVIRWDYEQKKFMVYE